MDTMYKLTKQIDALTYNSRAVLNALVRSCIAAGSSNGYTVKRYDVSLTLNRADIFRLYDFYQNWANGSYGYEPYTSNATEFADIVARCDAKWEGGQLVTQAIVTHSKILYLVSTNRDENGSDYWLGLIRDSSTPKLITNSAPIPLNLRTPLYESDLSTKSFSQYETYLFPSGYNKLAITGMPGDNEDHVGGGRSWLWDIDSSIDITAPRITLGSHTNNSRRVGNYRDTRYSMSFGVDTYALGERSVSLGGLCNVAEAEDGATLGGNGLLAAGTRSAVIGGYYNVTAGENSVAFGDTSHGVGPMSMAGNDHTCTGDFSYAFTVEEPETNTRLVECEAVKDTVSGKCATTDAGTALLAGEGRNTVRISYSDIVSNGHWELKIEKGDSVLVYAQTRKDDTGTCDPTAVEGYAFKPLTFKVANVTRDNGDYLVQLDGSIPRGETFDSMTANGGRITRRTVDLREMNYAGNLLNPVAMHPGQASNAFNFNTVTPGVNQTVVGQMNMGDRDAKFVVGTGSSYIGSRSFRRNGLAVAQGYGYMQTADQSAMIGVSTYGDTAYRDFDAKYVLNGAWMRHSGDGLYESVIAARDTRTEVALFHRDDKGESSHLTMVRSGSGYISNEHDVTTLLESMAGTVVISAGSYIGAKHPYDVLLAQSNLLKTEGNAVAIYSENGMELRNTNSDRTMSFHNSGYISATFKGLWLNGTTWGALPTTDDALSHWVFHDPNSNYSNPFTASGHCVDYPNVIAQSGFFYSQNDWSAGKTPAAGRINLPKKLSGNWEEHEGRGFHIVNSAVSYINAEGLRGYDVSCLVMPGQVMGDEVDTPPHPKFINSFIYGTGNNGVMPNETYVTEELAYMSDLKKLRIPTVSSYISVLDGSSVTNLFYREVDEALWDSTNNVPRTDPVTTSDQQGTFRAGVVQSGSVNLNMMGYFGVGALSTNSFKLCGYSAASVITLIPSIRAPADNPNSLKITRYGNIVAMSALLEMKPEQYSEMLVVTRQRMMGSLGATGSLVLSGTAMSGVSVKCTISSTINTSLTILGNNYDSDCMCQFLIYNPYKVKDCTIPITLVGTLDA